MAKLEKYIRLADLGDNAATGFVNYGVKKKSRGRYRLARVLMLLLYVAFVLIYALGLMASNILPPIALTPLLTWILVFFTWRFVSVEYEYYILDGEFKMLKIYGSKNMRELCRVRVSSMKVIAPYRDEYKAAADALPKGNRTVCVSSMSAPDIYYAIYDKGGAEYVILFEATQKTVKVLRYYNPNTVITKTVH